MGMKVVLKTIAYSLALSLLLCGCAKRVQVEPKPVEVLDIFLAPWEATPSPPAASAPPVPLSPAPEPEPTADPYAGLDRISLAKDAEFFHVKLGEEIKARITGMSYPKNDKSAAVKYGDLRYLRILYVNFEGETCKGELTVHARLADELMGIFHQLFESEYPLASVTLVDDFGEPGDDNLSMAANNTSCFNYRQVSGSRTLSLHSYGMAVDINPVQNPYLSGKRVSPPAGTAYVDRSLGLPGMIDEDDLCYQLFTAHGWNWGGHFAKDKDYQHFSKDVR